MVHGGTQKRPHPERGQHGGLYTRPDDERVYATKAFVLSFSEAIANELKGSGVTVTALCPGPTASNFQAKAEMGDSKLVKGRKLPSAYDVAVFGFEAAQKGKVVAIHGLMNVIQANTPRFLPRNVVAQVVRNAQDRAH